MRVGFLVAAIALFVACNSEPQTGGLRPEWIAPPSFESPTSPQVPTPSASPTLSPTAKPVATPEPTSTPAPTSTPTAAERYGPLIVEGAYDWPREMPDDLTEDEIFAVNIFVSAENADFAAIAAGSADLAEFDVLTDYMPAELIEGTGRTIALDAANERTQLVHKDGLTALRSIVRSRSAADPAPLFRTCEFISTTFKFDDGSEEEGERFTVWRDLFFEQTERGYFYLGWRIVETRDGAVACGE